MNKAAFIIIQRGDGDSKHDLSCDWDYNVISILKFATDANRIYSALKNVEAHEKEHVDSAYGTAKMYKLP